MWSVRLSSLIRIMNLLSRRPFLSPKKKSRASGVESHNMNFDRALVKAPSARRKATPPPREQSPPPPPAGTPMHILPTWPVQSQEIPSEGTMMEEEDKGVLQWRNVTRRRTVKARMVQYLNESDSQLGPEVDIGRTVVNAKG